MLSLETKARLNPRKTKQSISSYNAGHVEYFNVPRSVNDSKAPKYRSRTWREWKLNKEVALRDFEQQSGNEKPINELWTDKWYIRYILNQTYEEITSDRDILLKNESFNCKKVDFRHQ